MKESLILINFLSESGFLLFSVAILAIAFFFCISVRNEKHCRAALMRRYDYREAGFRIGRDAEIDNASGRSKTIRLVAHHRVATVVILNTNIVNDSCTNREMNLFKTTVVTTAIS